MFITSAYTASADGEIFLFLIDEIMLSSLQKHKKEQVYFNFEKKGCMAFPARLQSEHTGI